MRRLALGLVACALSLPVLCAQAAEMTLRKGGKDGASVRLRVEAPSYEARPGVQLYGGPYPVPYPYYYPPPLYPAPDAHAPSSPAPAPQPVSVAGHVILLVDPLAAEVHLDGVRLNRRDDLSYGIAVLEGRYLLRVAAPGFETHEQALEVSGGRGMFVTVRLAPDRTRAESSEGR